MLKGPLLEREVVGSNPGRAIPNALKIKPVASLLYAQHYKASIGISSHNNYRKTYIAIYKKSDNDPMSVFTGGQHGSLAVMLNTFYSSNIEIDIITVHYYYYYYYHYSTWFDVR